ncbi:hypothetical protein [Haladaptatus sp. NG-WS-4]
MGRRTYLTTVGSVLSVPLISGSLGEYLGSPSRAGSRDDAVDESQSTREVHGPTRGENDVEVTVRTVEDDENVEYIEENDTDEVSSGITSAVEGDDRAAFVSVETVLDREGEVVRESTIEFEALVAATPATVDATYVIDEHEHRCDVPVNAKSSVIRYQ